MQKFFLLLFVVLCFGGRDAAAQDNLIANPGFEESSSKSKWPDGGWWLSQSVGDTIMGVDHTTFHHGAAAVRLTSSAAEKCVLVSPKFKVSPGDDMRFEAWVRGAELPAGKNTAYAGLVFRTADAKILERRYVASDPLYGDWVRISGTAHAPPETAYAELHLGYTNGPGTIWYDDVSAVITSPLSMSIVDGVKPWPGQQVITVKVTNHLPGKFRGSLLLEIAEKTTATPVELDINESAIVRVQATLNGVGLHPYKITLFDSKGASEKTMQGKFKTSEPLVLFPPKPSYDFVQASEKDVLLDAGINIDPNHRKGMKLSVTVTDPKGKDLQTIVGEISQGELTELHVLVPCNEAGVFTLNAKMMDSAAHEVAEAHSEIHIIPHQDAQVKIGTNGFLIVGGKPEFPIGLYNSSRDPELAKAGFNATHNYNISSGDAEALINPTDPQLKGLLDQSWSNGMRMMVELPRKAIEDGQWTQVVRRIETFRHHPGLLCWGSEERVARGMTKPAHIATLYALVKQMDPDHPLVLGDTRDVIEKLMVDRRDFFPDTSMDVGIWWWYPIPMQPNKCSALEGREQAGDLMEPPSWLTTTHSKKPLWIAIQAYQKPQKDARFPTPEEYRCEAYLSIISGVKGLFFYCGSGQKDYLGKPSGILNKPELGHWEYVKQLTAELRDFSPVIMAAKCASQLQLTPTNAPVEFTARELDGKFYLIAANKSGRPQTARWQGDILRDKTPATLFENHPVKMEEDTFSDTFPPYGVHVYRFD